MHLLRLIATGLLLCIMHIYTSSTTRSAATEATACKVVEAELIERRAFEKRIVEGGGHAQIEESIEQGV